jgi:hypothetical protein
MRPELRPVLPRLEFWAHLSAHTQTGVATPIVRPYAVGILSEKAA